jgi:hypothetical protein
VRPLRRGDRSQAVSAPTRELVADLAATLALLNDDEVRVVLLIAKRLVVGRKAYGPLDIQGDRRDWGHEASEEALDCAVYLAAETLRREARP